ncbi:MAG: hypothetical protein ACTSRG_20250 [Candidatus Helarchaeota archaeon]
MESENLTINNNSDIVSFAEPYGYIYMIKNKVNSKKYIGQTKRIMISQNKKVFYYFQKKSI